MGHAEPVVGPKDIRPGDLGAVVGQDNSTELIDGIFEAQRRLGFGVAGESALEAVEAV